jgi:hypothetical protein
MGNRLFLKKTICKFLEIWGLDSKISIGIFDNYDSNNNNKYNGIIIHLINF